MSTRYKPLDDGDPEPHPQSVPNPKQKVCVRLDRTRHADICDRISVLEPIDVLNALEMGLAIQELGEDLVPILGKFFKRRFDKKVKKNGIMEKMRKLFLAMKERFGSKN